MLTLRDKIALIYTGAGSQRRVAAFIGISHQRVGRILKGEAGRSLLTDPDVIALVNQAYAIHKKVTAQQARIDALPYYSHIPVFIQRMPLQVTETVPDGRPVWDGEKYVQKYKQVPVRDARGKIVTVPGDRVAALHSHWLSSDQRDEWIAAMHASKKFVGLSIASIVNLVTYSQAAERLRKGLANDPKRDYDRLTILAKIEGHLRQEVVQGQMHTKITPMTMRLPFVLDDVNTKLQSKHAPHTGDEFPGTRLASSMLMQVDTRAGANGESKDSEFRSKHPYKGKTKPRKARANTKRAKRRQTRR